MTKIFKIKIHLKMILTKLIIVIINRMVLPNNNFLQIKSQIKIQFSKAYSNSLDKVNQILIFKTKSHRIKHYLIIVLN